MKKIRFAYGFAIQSVEAGETVEITPQLHESLKAARFNRLHVIEAALTMEGRLEDALVTHFLGQPEQAVNCHGVDLYFRAPQITRAKREAFASQILASQWCTFAAKLRLIQTALLEVGTAKKEVEAFIDKLRKVMDCRNAFTHGKLVFRGGVLNLEFFKQVPCVQPLTDEYLTKIETEIASAFEAVGSIRDLLGGERSLIELKQIEKGGEKYEIGIDGQEGGIVDLAAPPSDGNLV